MRKLLASIFAIAVSLTAFAQTAEEIVDRMESAFNDRAEQGIFMIVDVSVPVVGSLTSKSWILEDKMRVEASMLGVSICTWYDDETVWTYNSRLNEVEIKNFEGRRSTDGGDTEMFLGISDGYDVSIKDETNKVWYITCKKSRSNKEKNAPKTMDLVVAKGSYDPVSLSAKLSGVNMTMRDISFGVTEEQVTFNPADYPGVTYNDRRE